MQKVNAKQMKKEFLKFANGSKFPKTLFEWQDYDGATKQLFIWADGEWNEDIRHKLQDFLQRFNKKITISRLIKTEKMV